MVNAAEKLADADRLVAVLRILRRDHQSILGRLTGLVHEAEQAGLDELAGKLQEFSSLCETDDEHLHAMLREVEKERDRLSRIVSPV